VCQVLNIIVLCSLIYLDYFWCIKYQYMNLYMKIGKRNGKKKRKRDFPANWAGGISAQPRRVRARPRGRAAQSATEEGNGAGTAPWARGHAPERGGGNGVRWGRRAVHDGENWSPVNPTVVPRRWSGSASMEWLQSMRGGRGLRRWGQFGWWTLRMAGPRRVAGSAAVRSPMRPSSATGKAKMVPWDR
jgi:hypothetical protein